MSLDGKLHLAPIGENIQRVLDVGTGTGMDYDYHGGAGAQVEKRVRICGRTRDRGDRP